MNFAIPFERDERLACLAHVFLPNVAVPTTAHIHTHVNISPAPVLEYLLDGNPVQDRRLPHGRRSVVSYIDSAVVGDSL